MDTALKTYFVSAFPGCGKSTFVGKHPQVSDSDSLKFPKDKFPWNYLGHIRDMAIDGKCALISSHAAVRDGVSRIGIAYVLVYPSMECKDEYIQRYRERGSPEAFVQLLTKQWENWIGECEAYENVKIALKPGQFLSDVIHFDEVDQVIRLTPT